MTPNLQNIQLFVAVTFGIALVLAGLLFAIQKISGRKFKWGGLIIFAVAAYGLPIVGFASKYIGDRETLRREATTSGIVVEHGLPNHNQYRFEYAISGRRYYSWHQGTVTCSPGEIYIGKTVLVYYDPNTPRRPTFVASEVRLRMTCKFLGCSPGCFFLLLSSPFDNKEAKITTAQIEFDTDAESDDELL